jgi:hypothetical protein
VTVDERLAGLCAERLGLERAIAAQLLEAAARDLGQHRYTLRAAAFAVAVQPRLERVLPAALRRRAVVGLVGPLLASPAARNVYGAGRDALLADPSAGLLRRR